MKFILGLPTDHVESIDEFGSSKAISEMAKAAEAKNYFGGHTNTVDVTNSQEDLISVDTGFIVFNDRTYPNFMRLLGELGVSYQPSEMSFGIKHEPSGLNSENHHESRRALDMGSSEQ